MQFRVLLPAEPLWLLPHQNLAFAIYLDFYFFGHGNSLSKDIDVLLPVFFRKFILAAALVETTIAE